MLSVFAPHGPVKFFGRTTVLGLCLFLGVRLFWAMPGQCADSSQENMEQIKDRIVEEKQKIHKISRKESSVMEQLDLVEKDLFQSREKARVLAREIENLKIRIQDHSQQQQNLAFQLDANREYLAQRLNAMYRINGAKLYHNHRSFFDFLVTCHAMERIVQSDMAVMENQTKGLADLQQVGAQLAQAKTLHSDKQRQLEDHIQRMEADSKKKQAVLRNILQKKDLALAALQSLEMSAKKLDQTVASLEISKNREPVEKGFPAWKGKLRTPVSGDILSAYGPSTLESGKGFYFQSGIDISAQRGAPVRSIFKGEIAYANWLKGYGNLVIVDHGDHYYSLYAHVEEMLKETGDQVETGEIIATVGDTGSMKGTCLHFEIRHHGKPVNPDKWIGEGA